LSSSTNKKRASNELSSTPRLLESLKHGHEFHELGQRVDETFLQCTNNEHENELFTSHPFYSMGIHPFFIDTARLESTTSVKKSNEL
jgi:hypothetical protein